MNKFIRAISYASVAGLISCGPMKPPPPPPPAPPAEKVAAKPPPTPEEMEKMFKEYGVPGPEHEKLKLLVGNWKYESKMWMSPDGQPEITKGTSDNRLILGGRFLEETVKGKVMGMPFEGRGIWGYDRVKKEYSTVWLDTMMTGVMLSEGTFDESAKAVKEEGTFSCPVEGTKKMRSVLTLADPKHPKFETFMNDPSGKEFKSMEINYRK